MRSIQTTSSLFMVAPTTFGFDEQTAATNTFQHELDRGPKQITQTAIQEFEAYVATLRAHDIAVIDFHDSDDQPKPNAVFPNNWFTTWPDGTVYCYPMATPSRRVERSAAALDLLGAQFDIRQVVDMSTAEADATFLEGTGVMVFDHPARTVYACVSPRCNEALFTKHAETLGYKAVAFHASDPSGTAIYHTNVMLGVQSHTAVLYSEGISDKAERNAVLDSLAASGHDIIDISFEQLTAFCGNILNVSNAHSEPFIVLSQTAFDAFTAEQRARLTQSGTLLPVSIPTIETIGGGSARCMIAEIFLPSK